MKRARKQQPIQPPLPQMQPVRLEKFHLFWILAIALSILLTAIMARDITKPFVEMHSWGHAHDAWVARSHVKYGLGYTKGFDTFAVGNPPAVNPTRYLDHPVLFTLINAAVMYALGINEWSMRAVNIICTIIALLLFLKILRHLFDDVTSLLAGLFFCLFPLIAFYGVNMWLYPLALLAYWCYLSLIGALKDSAVKKWHKPVLAIAIFLAIQMTWEGFFFAMAMGIHYVCHCIHKRKRPDGSLLLILAIAPFASLALDFIILAAGQNWDFKRLFELARIRSSSGELGGHLTWTVWFARFVEHAFTNFSLPVIIAVIFSLTIGQLYASVKKNIPRPYSIKFSQFWLFFMPALFQLTLLKGTLYPHQYWERPMVLFMATAATLAVMIIFDMAKKLKLEIAVFVSAAVTILLCAGCVYGINYYYGIRWQNPKRIEMFKYLNSKIPEDEALLSLDSFTIDQFPGIKAASYRPETAWYLDREIICPPGSVYQVTGQDSAIINIPKFMADTEQKAKTGKYPVYLIPVACEYTDKATGQRYSVANIQQVINEFAKKYKFNSEYGYIEGVSRKVPWTDFAPWIYTLNPYAGQDTFYQQAMLPYLVFDLKGNPSSKQ